MADDRRTHLPSLAVALLCALALTAVGCRSLAPAEQRLAADREVAAILEATQQSALGEAQGFSMETAYSRTDPAVLDPAAIVAERDVAETLEVDLAEALRLAARHSREFQNRRESLYLSALALTGARHVFARQGFGTGGADVNRAADGEVTLGADTRFGLTQLLQDGTDLSVQIANDILRYTNGNPADSASTILSFSVMRPLLRGAGAQVVAERLTQAERDVIYEVRAFARFQQSYCVEIADSYYRLLQQRDTVRNEYANYQNLIRARERAEALSVDRLPAFQVDQTRQDELNARNRYVQAITAYRTRLDAFKLQLGLPVGTQLRLADRDLQALVDGQIAPFTLDEAAAVLLARRQRLDLLTQLDRFDDARRQVPITADDLRPGLDLFGDADLRSHGSSNWERLDPDDLELSLGLRFDLPFDRLDERNAYVRSLIAVQKSLRDLQEAADTIRNDVRTAARTLDDARKRYAIQQNAVALAQKRVESANILLQAGRAETRDLLDAQSALVRTRNDLTQVLVDYRLARLRLLRDLGAIAYGPDGIVELNIDAAKAPDAPPDAIDSPLITPDELFGG